ncbi:MAG: diguanylate cyclase, partial [Mariprofundaceae bacterium]|nr:diguanylate cyclase [Mariprofundaceae bacterium]
MSKLKNIFGDPAKSIAIEQRGKVLANVLNITIPIIITFSLFNYFYDYNALALVQLGSLLLIVPAWLLARRKMLVATGEFLALFSTALILLYLIYDGGIAGLGLIWGWLFPFIAFYIAGIRRGWYWCIGFLAVASAIIMLSLGVTASYDLDTRVLFFTAYFFYLIVGYWFNAIRFRYLFDLERQVSARTAQLEHASLHDSLTDMPNRPHVTDYIQTLIDRKDKNFAVLNLDIARFSEINNVLGYDNGDLLLKAFAERIRSYADKTLFAGRMGGDEFTMVLHDLPAGKSEHESRSIVLKHARELLKAMERPYEIDNAAIELEITVGIELPTTYNTNASHMIRRANFACHTAKRSQDKVSIYDSDQDATSARQFHLFGGLKRAIHNRELRLFYQPKVDMRLGRVTDVEALIRWDSPEEGLIPPNQFIPVAESTGLIHPVTKYVLDEAMRQQALWIKKEHRINIAINLSARSLMEP